MEPKDKAKELVDKFKKYSRSQSSGFLVSNEDIWIKNAKENALICVDEIINELSKTPASANSWGEEKVEYWLEVKKEIELL
jgi:hypothetical protein